MAKSLTQKLSPKNIKKETKRTIKKGITMLIVSALLLIGVLFLFGFKVRFVLSDELSVELNPLDLSLSIKNNEPADVQFKVMNRNFLQCKSQCEFTLTELKNNDVLSSDSQIMEHNQEIVKNYLLAPPGKGEGQLMYNFEVTCYNIKSVICFTKEPRRRKSAIITVNYELTDEEKEAKNKTKAGLEAWFSGIKKAYRLVEENRLIAARLPSGIKEKAEIKRDSDLAQGKLVTIGKEKEKLIDLWADEGYISLGNKFSEEYVNEIQGINDDLTSAQEKAINIVRLRNDNIGLFEEVLGFRSRLLGAVNFYQKQGNTNNNQKLNDINKLADKIYSDYLVIKEGKEAYEETLNNFLSNEVDELKFKLSNFAETMLRGLFLIIYGENLLNVKEGVTSNDASYEFSCDELRSITSKIDDENNESAAFEDAYNLSFDPQELLEKAGVEIELKALTKTKEYVEGSSIDGKDILLRFIDEEIALRVSQTYSPDIPVFDLYQMIVFNNSRNKAYLADNCKAASMNTSAKADSVHKMLGMDVSSLNMIKTGIPLVEIDMATQLGENPAMCCVLGDCVPCCEEGCADSEEMFPVLFIHGHTVNEANTPEFTMEDFAKIQKKMLDDGYINIGELNIRANLYDVIKGEWSKSMKPITVRASYYYITYYDVGAYSVEMQKSERIENYAIRLREIINLLKYRTSAKKVNIVAHSMGGLVTRQYLDLFGTNDVNKVITVNTPHKGISGRVRRICSILGASKECNDMSEGSIFLERLNSKPIPREVEFHAIRSVGCKMDYGKYGDGIVTEESARLEGAKNYIINGECTDTLQTSLHTNALNPYIYPQTYELIVSILKE